MDTRSVSAIGISPVAKAKTVSPSIGVWEGRVVRAIPSWAMAASRSAWSFVSAAFVATVTSVVLLPSGTLPPGRRRRYSMTSQLSMVAARPAIVAPLQGSMMSPTALTTARAATTRPPASRSLALPSPPFTRKPAPPIFATVAPVSGSDAALLEAVPRGRRRGPVAGLRIRTDLPDSRPKVEDHCASYDRHNGIAHAVSGPPFFQVAHYAAGRVEAKSTAPR